MIAVDLFAGDKEKSALANSVLKWGKYISSLVGSELHVVHTWHLLGETKMRGRTLNAKTVDRLVQDEEKASPVVERKHWKKSDLNKKRYRFTFTKEMQSI